MSNGKTTQQREHLSIQGLIDANETAEQAAIRELKVRLRK